MLKKNKKNNEKCNNIYVANFASKEKADSETLLDELQHFWDAHQNGLGESSLPTSTERQPPQTTWLGRELQRSLPPAPGPLAIDNST